MPIGKQTVAVRLNASGAGQAFVQDAPATYVVASCSTGTATVAAGSDAETSLVSVSGGTANAIATVVLSQTVPSGQTPRVDLGGSLARGFISGEGA